MRKYCRNDLFPLSLKFSPQVIRHILPTIAGAPIVYAKGASTQEGGSSYDGVEDNEEKVLPEERQAGQDEKDL